MNIATHSVGVPFPKRSLLLARREACFRVPRYSIALVTSDRQSNREVEMRTLARFSAAYHQFVHEQFDTLVLLPKGTIYLGTQQNTIRLSVCKRTMEPFYHRARKAEMRLRAGAFHPRLKDGSFKPVFL